MRFARQRVTFRFDRDVGDGDEKMPVGRDRRGAMDDDVAIDERDERAGTRGRRDIGNFKDRTDVKSWTMVDFLNG